MDYVKHFLPTVLVVTAGSCTTVRSTFYVRVAGGGLEEKVALTQLTTKASGTETALRKNFNDSMTYKYLEYLPCCRH